MKCASCGNLLQSYELLKAHTSVENSCGCCNQSFKSTCDLLKHNCSGGQVKKRRKSTDKRLRINNIKTEVTEEAKNEPSDSSNVVVLKNVNDSNIPAILDEDAPLARRKQKF